MDSPSLTGCACSTPSEGSLSEPVVSPLRTHDMAYVPTLHPRMRPNDILLDDRVVCPYAHLAPVSSRAGLQVVFRIHQRQFVSFVGIAAAPSRRRGPVSGGWGPALRTGTPSGIACSVRAICRDRAIASVCLDTGCWKCVCWPVECSAVPPGRKLLREFRLRVPNRRKPTLRRRRRIFTSFILRVTPCPDLDRRIAPGNRRRTRRANRLGRSRCQSPRTIRPRHRNGFAGRCRC